MSAYTSEDRSEIICSVCGEKMKLGKLTLSYLGNNFPVELSKCEKCGLVYIPEDLALGKMEQVEKTLEDK